MHTVYTTSLIVCKSSQEFWWELERAGAKACNIPRQRGGYSAVTVLGYFWSIKASEMDFLWKPDTSGVTPANSATASLILSGEVALVAVESSMFAPSPPRCGENTKQADYVNGVKGGNIKLVVPPFDHRIEVGTNLTLVIVFVKMTFCGKPISS